VQPKEPSSRLARRREKSDQERGWRLLLREDSVMERGASAAA